MSQQHGVVRHTIAVLTCIKESIVWHGLGEDGVFKLRSLLELYKVTKNNAEAGT